MKHRDHILAEDLEHFLNAKHAVEAFDMLADDKDGKASHKDVCAAVCTIFRCCQLFARQFITSCMIQFGVIYSPKLSHYPILLFRPRLE